eukprot:scaffold3337_cov169-Amphora_coffeaeformis.AAC.14
MSEKIWRTLIDRALCSTAAPADTDKSHSPRFSIFGDGIGTRGPETRSTHGIEPVGLSFLVFKRERFWRSKKVPCQS